jgi:protein-S-isoprenylcysteine O-methyltransferase Ste14
VTAYETALLISAITAACVFVSLQFVSAPYGRHARGGWGPSMPSKLGWMVMEGVAAVAIVYFFWRQRPTMTPTLWLLLGLWEIHYINRSFVFPLRMRTSGKSNPIAVVAMAMGFNAWNGYLNGHWLGVHAQDYTTAWMQQPSFYIGAVLFATGFGVNVWSDEILMRLRQGADTGYAIPRGGLFRFVSCPNYFGELIEWCGWALMTRSPAGLVFVLWTAANLVPRARSHHRWYKKEFAEYPPERRAIIPFIY